MQPRPAFTLQEYPTPYLAIHLSDSEEPFLNELALFFAPLRAGISALMRWTPACKVGLNVLRPVREDPIDNKAGTASARSRSPNQRHPRGVRSIRDPNHTGTDRF